ncbi:hypothetical protein SS50377_20168 [Spironucleus salmonicida]|uniref:Uncharacterized protein n=1 Tax=Spironucleus salmonicida TaxID=348837 RepID=V6LLY2_9EUKA|nr:hypothetical protein SS50377_20168 [Spironucleus salmonicida]|eukprot:EST45223.1 Hypothetical protein SS50377_14798 [Spironucleus salmonicida]
MKTFLTKSEKNFLTKNEIMDEIQVSIYQKSQDGKLERLQGNKRLNSTVIPKVHEIQRRKSILESAVNNSIFENTQLIKSLENNQIQFSKSNFRQIEDQSYDSAINRQVQSLDILLLSNTFTKKTQPLYTFQKSTNIDKYQLIQNMTNSKYSSNTQPFRRIDKSQWARSKEMLTIKEQNNHITLNVISFGEKSIDRPESSCIIKESNEKYRLQYSVNDQQVLGRIRGKTIQ